MFLKKIAGILKKDMLYYKLLWAGFLCVAKLKMSLQSVTVTVYGKAVTKN